jgi:DNA-binding transcriptional LysR family regulator
MSYLHSLSVFTAVAEEKSFSAAAKKLELTQPTVSFHIDNLEKQFGCPLFVRNTKGVTLTVYGEKLYCSTQKIHAIAKETENHIKALVSGEAGQITIGASTIPGEYILPGFIAEFLRCRPGIKVSIRTANSQAILAEFLQGHYAFSIVGMKPDPTIHSIPLWHDRLVLAAHPDLADQLNDNADIVSILAQPLVVRESTSGTKHTVLRILKEHNITQQDLNIVFEVTSNEALKTALLQKAGIGFISSWAIEYELASGRLKTIALPGINMERTFYALRQASLSPTCVEHVWQFLLSQSND